MRKIKIVSSLFLINCLFLLGACENFTFFSRNDGLNNLSKDSLELEKSKIELEKKRIELEKEKINQEKNRLQQTERNDRTIQLTQKAQSFYSSPDAIVVSEKAYFYNSPDYTTKRKAYLVKGDLLTALRVSNSFIYVEFYSPYLNKTSKGWIDVSDIEHY
jgi:hypothetical protein